MAWGRLKGPGGLYNLGNALGLVSGIAASVQAARHGVGALQRGHVQATRTEDSMDAKTRIGIHQHSNGQLNIGAARCPPERWSAHQLPARGQCHPLSCHRPRARPGFGAACPRGPRQSRRSPPRPLRDNIVILLGRPASPGRPAVRHRRQES